MIIVKLQGRLGNQMFQYAFAKAMETEGKTVKIDSSQLKYDNLCNELGILNCTLKEATQAEVKRYGDCKKSFLSKVRRNLGFYKHTHVREGRPIYQEKIKTMDEVYFDGYWQTDKYFKTIADTIRSEFVFVEDMDEQNINVLNEIEKQCSISLHIRRGDYLSEKHAPIHGNICSENYYTKAITYYTDKYENAKFFVFTDDVAWAKENYKDDNRFYIVDVNSGKNSYRDMQLMSKCNHHIIANSSFSWWGAWLNEKVDKEVIAPSIWLNGIDTPDVWCENWIRMEH